MPVVVVDDDGTIVHPNAACTKLADGVELDRTPLASFFVADDAAGIANLIADGFAGGYDESPIFTRAAPTAPTVQVVLQALSVLPGPAGGPQLAMRVRAARRSDRCESPSPRPGPTSPPMSPR